MPRKPSAHSQLDQLRQAAVHERVRARDLQAQVEAGKATVEHASAAVTDAYAADDEKLARSRRKALETAEAEVVDLGHRAVAARQRAEQAQRRLDSFLQERVHDLLAERDESARAVTADLTRSVHETLKLARAYIAERENVDRLVASVPGATPRADGPPAAHAWERPLQDLERAVRKVPELPAPLPRWHGLAIRERQDKVHRLLRLKRAKKPDQEQLDPVRREVA